MSFFGLNDKIIAVISNKRSLNGSRFLFFYFEGKNLFPDFIWDELKQNVSAAGADPVHWFHRCSVPAGSDQNRAITGSEPGQKQAITVSEPDKNRTITGPEPGAEQTLSFPTVSERTAPFFEADWEKLTFSFTVFKI